MARTCAPKYTCEASPNSRGQRRKPSSRDSEMLERVVQRAGRSRNRTRCATIRDLWYMTIKRIWHSRNKFGLYDRYHCCIRRFFEWSVATTTFPHWFLMFLGFHSAWTHSHDPITFVRRISLIGISALLTFYPHLKCVLCSYKVRRFALISQTHCKHLFLRVALHNRQWVISAPFETLKDLSYRIAPYGFTCSSCPSSLLASLAITPFLVSPLLRSCILALLLRARR